MDVLYLNYLPELESNDKSWYSKRDSEREGRDNMYISIFFIILYSYKRYRYSLCNNEYFILNLLFNRIK